MVVPSTVIVPHSSGGDATGKLVNSGVKFLFGWSDSLHLGAAATAIGVVLAIAFFLLLVRIFSVLLALLQYYDFSLTRLGKRLTVQRGLLSRLRSSLPLRRIQAYTLSEGWLHRRFNKRSLKVDSAAGAAINEEGKSPLRDLVPLAGPERMDALIAQFLASD